MENVKAMFDATLAVFKIPITIYGFTFSFWNVFLFVIVGGMVLAFIGRLFND